MREFEHTFSVGEWTVHPNLGTLTRGETTEHLEPKQMTLLIALAKRQGEVVDKDTIRKEVWEGAYIAESGLARNISQLRKIFGDSAKDPAYIATIPKKGYRLVASVITNETPTNTTTTKRTENPRPIKPGLQSRSLSRHVLIPVALILFISTALVLRYKLRHHQPATSNDAHSHRKIAVLPLENLNGDEANAFFAYGLTEELTVLLSKIDHFSVIAPTTTYTLKDQGLDTLQICDRLDVGHMLTGSVQREGNQLRIHISLADAKSGTQAWSERFDRPAADIFAVQEEIAARVAETLQIKLRNTVTNAPTTYRGNIEAYDNYLLGQYWCHKGSALNLPKAIGYFEKACEIDPTYAQAWAALGRTWMLMGMSGRVAPETYLPKAEHAATRALTLARHTDEALATMGMILLCRDLNWQEGEQYLQKAVAANPQNPLTRMWFAQFLSAGKRHGEAIEQARIGIDLDPVNKFVLLNGAHICLNGDDYSTAETFATRALAIDDDFFPARLIPTLALSRQNRWQEALDLYAALDPTGNRFPTFTAQALAHTGNEEKSREITDRLLQSHETDGAVPPYALAEVFAALEDKAALIWLERAVTDRDPLCILNFGPSKDWSAFKDHPRYQALAEQLGFFQPKWRDSCE